MKIAIICVVVSLFTSLNSFAHDMMFQHFGAEQGMPQIALWGLCQDADDNIWVIGDRALYRYNGFDVRKFIPGSDGMESLPGTEIYDTKADSEGRIWVTCGNRIGYYDTTSHRFEIIETTFRTKFYFINEFAPGVMLLISSNECFKYDVAASVLTSFLKIDAGEDFTAEFRADSLFYFATSSGRVLEYNRESGSLKTLCDCNSYIQDVYCTDREVWLGTRGEGLFVYDKKGSLSRRFSKGPGKTNLISDHIRATILASDGKIWVGTLHGLDIIDPETGMVEHHTKDINDGYSLSHNTIRCFLRDSTGGMWIGTYFGGLNYWHPKRHRFISLRMRPGGGQLNDDVAACIVETSDGVIWIGTNKGGVNSYNPKDGSFKYFFLSQNNLKGNEFNDVKAILPDGDYLYIGAYGGGFNILDRKTERIRRLNSRLDVYSLAAFDEESILLGTSQGLYRYYKGTDRYDELASGNYRMVYKASDSSIWAGGDYGIRRFSIKGDGITETTPYGLASYLGLREVRESAPGRYCLSTSGGLFFYEDFSETARGPVLCDGEAVLDVNGCEFDSQSNIWISTKSGLYMFKPSNGECHRYTRSSGLISEVLLDYSHCYCSNGLMMFGGLGGINIFNPDDFAEKIPVPRAYVSSIFIRDSKYIIDASHLKRLSLKHNQNYISFLFSAPDFLGGNSTRFNYILEGFDESRHKTGMDRVATYSNLPKGKYLLKVWAENSDGAESDTCSELMIIQHPVWYKTTFAIVCWIVLLLMTASSAVMMILRHKDLKNKLMIQELEKKYAKEMNKYKALKFVNSYRSDKDAVKDLSSSDERFILEILNIVESRISDSTLNVDSLAGCLGISRTSLLVRVKRITGASAIELIHKVRFTKACELLSAGELTIAEICYKTGFSSPSYFTARFKKYFGYTPKEYYSKST